MAASGQGGSYTKICLAAALAGSVGLALYYGYRKRQKSPAAAESEDNKKQDGERKENGIRDSASKASSASADNKDQTKGQYYPIQPVTENKKEVLEKEKPKDLKLKEKTADIKSSVKDTAEAVKDKAGELKDVLGTSLSESTFSFLGDDKDDKEDNNAKDRKDSKEDKKEKGETSPKDDIVIIDDIVVIEESQQSHAAPPPPSFNKEIIVPESANFAQSLPSLSDQPTSLSAFELSSLEADLEKRETPSASSAEQPQSLSTYEFPSLEPEKSKPDNGSDIEVLPSDEKSKLEEKLVAAVDTAEKPASEPPGASHIPKAKKDSKKPGVKDSASSAAGPSSSETGGTEAKRDGKDTKGAQNTKDTKPKGRRGSKKRKDETDAASAEAQKKGKETTGKGKPPPVPPKPKQAKPDPVQVARDQEVHIKHPTNPGEFVSFGMRFESRDKTPDHIITGVEEGGPASEVGLQDGDMLLKLNDMDVTHWNRVVLIEQFRMIPSAEFDLTIKRNDQGKYFSVHIRDQEDGVAVSGVVIDVKNIPKSPQITLEAVEGPEAVQKCHLVALSGQCANVTDQGLMLQDKLVDDQSLNFEKYTFKEGDSQIIILKTSHKGSPVYITVLNRTTVGVQYDLEEDVTQLETADPRCFYLMKTRAGSYWLESTQFPDHYLCCKGGHFHLVSLTQASEVATNKNIRFSFEAI